MIYSVLNLRIYLIIINQINLILINWICSWILFKARSEVLARLNIFFHVIFKRNNGIVSRKDPLETSLLVIRIHFVEWNWRQAFYEHARTSPRVVSMGLLCVDLYLTTLPHCSHLASSRCNHRGSHPRRQPWPDLWDSRSVYSTDARFRSPSFSRPSSSLPPLLRQLASVSTSACTRRCSRTWSKWNSPCVSFISVLLSAHSRKARTYFGRTSTSCDMYREQRPN